MRHIDAIADGAPEPRQDEPGKYERAREIDGEIILDIKPPTKLTSLHDLTREMGRIYRMGLAGKLPLSASSKLIFQLQCISRNMIAEEQVAALQSAYSEAFRGLTIVAPANGVRPTNGANGANGASEGE